MIRKLIFSLTLALLIVFAIGFVATAPAQVGSSDSGPPMVLSQAAFPVNPDMFVTAVQVTRPDAASLSENVPFIVSASKVDNYENSADQHRYRYRSGGDRNVWGIDTKLQTHQRKPAGERYQT